MMTLSACRDRVAKGETHEAIVSDVLARAESDPAAAHVFTHLYAEGALAAARAADAAGADPARPLAGAPVTLKDLFDVAGETTLSGTVVRRDAAPAAQDAAVVSRLRQAGAAITGRTNMVEYALGGVGLNPHYGTPRNPADEAVARVPGGSSSGGAVSVGLGLAVAAVGSDTAGSVRIPAALCGLVGFKPTQARVPLTGAVELARTLDSVGPMAHTVADCLTMDAVLAGQGLQTTARPLSGMRLAAAQTLVLDDLDPQVAAAYERALRTLADAGAQVEEVALTEFGRIGDMNQPIGVSPIECYSAHRDMVDHRADQMDPRIATRLQAAAAVSAADYLHILDQRAAWIAETEQALAPFDAYLAPTVPMVAPEIGPLEDSDEAYYATNRLILRNPIIANWMDGCAFSLPCHRPGELPVGLMIGGPGHTDARVAEVALAAEAALAR